MIPLRPASENARGFVVLAAVASVAVLIGVAVVGLRAAVGPGDQVATPTVTNGNAAIDPGATWSQSPKPADLDRVLPEGVPADRRAAALAAVPDGYVYGYTSQWVLTAESRSYVVVFEKPGEPAPTTISVSTVTGPLPAPIEAARVDPSGDMAAAMAASAFPGTYVNVTGLAVPTVRSESNESLQAPTAGTPDIRSSVLIAFYGPDVYVTLTATGVDPAEVDLIDLARQLTILP